VGDPTLGNRRATDVLPKKTGAFSGEENRLFPVRMYGGQAGGELLGTIFTTGHIFTIMFSLK
jgi:hypothetical protein